MLCEQCEKRPATVHWTQIVNGDKSETHLCQVCAGEESEFEMILEPSFSIHDLLSGFFSHGPSRRLRNEFKQQQCSFCGQTYRDVAQTGLLGCPQCYDTFQPALDPLVQRIQGHNQHRGRTPAAVTPDEGPTGDENRKVSRAGRAAQSEIQRLRQEMRRAVDEEAFEEAAKLRDQIQELEDQLNQEDGD